MKKGETFKEAVVGAFMLAVLALLGYFTIIISGADVFSGRGRTAFSVVFDEVGGLKSHDSVMYRGTKVGKVESVEVTPSNLVVHVEVDSSVVLRENCLVAVCNLSMLGGNYLELKEGDGEKLVLSGATLKGEMPSDWMRDVSEVARNLRKITEMAEVKEAVTNFSAAGANVARLAGSAGRVVERIERGEGSIGKLLADDGSVYDELKRTLSGAAEITGRINRGEGALGRLLDKNDTLYDELKSAVSSFRKTCESLEMGAIKADAQLLVADARKLIETLNAVAGRLKEGEGTLGKLSRESELYDEVNQLVKDVRQIVDNYRDTTPITTFSSLLTGGF